MSTTRNQLNWLSLLDAKQLVLASRSLDKTLLYLRNARTPGEGWGAYPKLEPSLYHTALAIQALFYSEDPSTVGSVAGAAAFIRHSKGANLKGLSLRDICDLLTIARAEQRPDDESYIEELLDVLQQTYQQIESSGVDIPVTSLCSALLAVIEVRGSDIRLIKIWSEKLLDMQRPDGGWPAASGGDSNSVIATAMAVHVLTLLSTERSVEALKRGLYSLRKQLDDKRGLQNLSSGSDTYTIAIVLRSLAAAPVIEYNLIQEGIDSLVSRMNPDGSWGNGLGEPGNIEITALCLLALVEAGENRFVPSRLAKAAITDIQLQLNQITDERDKLSQDFDRRLQDECGTVVKERNDLIKENKEIKGRIEATQGELQKEIEARNKAELQQLIIEREMQRFSSSSLSRSESKYPLGISSTELLFTSLYALSSRTLVRIIILILPTICLAALTWWLWAWPPSWTRILIFVFLLLVDIFLTLFVFSLEERTFYRYNYRTKYSYDFMQDLLPSPYNYAQDLLPSGSEVSGLRRMYFAMADTWRPEIREEIAYRLRDIVEMPANIVTRYIEELSHSIGLNSDDRERLLVWTRYVSRLDVSQRRLLIEQLRRTYIT